MWRIVWYRNMWYAYHPNVNGKPERRSLRTNDRATAERNFHSQIIGKKDENPTCEDIFTAYMADKSSRASAQTLNYNWKALAPTFSNLAPEHVTRAVCRDYLVRRLSEGVKAGTVHRELTALSTALRWHNPQNGAVFEYPKKPPPKDRYLTKSEYRRLLDAAHMPHIRLFIVLALTTAARQQAILDLTWNKVDFERGLIYLGEIVREEGRKGRATVPMNAQAREALEDAYRASTCHYVIEWGGKQVKSIKRGFRETVKRADLKDVTPHTIRHTAAVYMAEAGVPMVEIAQFLGHKNTRTTEQVYARFSPGYLKSAADALLT